MVDRYNSRQTIQTDNVVNPTQSQVIGSPIDGLVNVLDNFVTENQKTLDRKTISRAKKAGALAGLNPNFTPAEGESQAVEAYNSAATESFINTTIVDVSTKVNELANNPQLRANPDALRDSLDSLGEGYMSNMPVDMLPQFQIAYNSQVERAVSTATNNRYTQQMEASRTSFNEMEKEMMIQITNAARDGDEATLNTALELFNTRLENNAPIDVGGNGILTLSEYTSRKNSLSKIVERELIIGDMLRTPDAQKPAFVEGLLKGDRLKEIMIPDEQTKFIGDMVSAYDAQSAVADMIKTQNNSALVAEVKELEKQFVLDPSEENLFKLMNHPKANAPFQYMQFYESRLTRSDPFDLEELEDLADRGQLTFEDLSFTDDNGEPNPTIRKIIADDRRALIEKISQTESGEGFEKTSLYKEFLNRVDEDYSRTDIIGRMLPNDEGKRLRRQVYDWMRTEWPKYQRGEIELPDPIKRYESLKNQIKPKQNSIHRVLNTSNEEIIIQQKYIDNPALLEYDLKNGLAPRMDDPIVIEYIKEKYKEKVRNNGR